MQTKQALHQIAPLRTIGNMTNTAMTVGQSRGYAAQNSEGYSDPAQRIVHEVKSTAEHAGLRTVQAVGRFGADVVKTAVATSAAAFFTGARTGADIEALADRFAPRRNTSMEVGLGFKNGVQYNYHEGPRSRSVDVHIKKGEGFVANRTKGKERIFFDTKTVKTGGIRRIRDENDVVVGARISRNRERTISGHELKTELSAGKGGLVADIRTGGGKGLVFKKGDLPPGTEVKATIGKYQLAIVKPPGEKPAKPKLTAKQKALRIGKGVGRGAIKSVAAVSVASRTLRKITGKISKIKNAGDLNAKVAATGKMLVGSFGKGVAKRVTANIRRKINQTIRKAVAKLAKMLAKLIPPMVKAIALGLAIIILLIVIILPASSGDDDADEWDEEEWEDYEELSTTVSAYFLQAIVAAMETTPSPGSNYCARWVSNVYEAVGFSFTRPASGTEYWKYQTQYGYAPNEEAEEECEEDGVTVVKEGDFSTVRVGMVIAVEKSKTEAGQKYGHVGLVYSVSDDEILIMDNIGYIRTITIESWIQKTDQEGTVRWGYPTWVDLIASMETAEELDLLAAAIYCEDNTSYDAMLACGYTIMNRVVYSGFADTLYGVLTASGQFSSYSNGKIEDALNNSSATSECYEAAETVLADYYNNASYPLNETYPWLYFHAQVGHSCTTCLYADYTVYSSKSNRYWVNY